MVPIRFHHRPRHLSEDQPPQNPPGTRVHRDTPPQRLTYQPPSQPPIALSAGPLAFEFLSKRQAPFHTFGQQQKSLSLFHCNRFKYELFPRSSGRGVSLSCSACFFSSFFLLQGLGQATFFAYSEVSSPFRAPSRISPLWKVKPFTPLVFFDLVEVDTPFAPGNVRTTNILTHPSLCFAMGDFLIGT